MAISESDQQPLQVAPMLSECVVKHRSHCPTVCPGPSQFNFRMHFLASPCSLHSIVGGRILLGNAGYSSAGVIVAVTILPAGLTWPTLAAVVYLAFFLSHVWCWARCSPAKQFSDFALGALQMYAGGPRE